MIELDNRWAISADSDNIIILYKPTSKKKDKESAWRIWGYYSTLHEALIGFTNQAIRETNLESLKILTEKMDSIYSLIKQMPNITVKDLHKSKEG